MLDQFKRPWHIVPYEDASFIVKDDSGRAIAYFYYRDDAGRQFKDLTRDEAMEAAQAFARLSK